MTVFIIVIRLDDHLQATSHRLRLLWSSLNIGRLDKMLLLQPSMCNSWIFWPVIRWHLINAGPAHLNPFIHFQSANTKIKTAVADSMCGTDRPGWVSAGWTSVGLILSSDHILLILLFSFTKCSHYYYQTTDSVSSVLILQRTRAKAVFITLHTAPV